MLSLIPLFLREKVCPASKGLVSTHLEVRFEFYSISNMKDDDSDCKQHALPSGPASVTDGCLTCCPIHKEKKGPLCCFGSYLHRQCLQRLYWSSCRCGWKSVCSLQACAALSSGSSTLTDDLAGPWWLMIPSCLFLFQIEVITVWLALGSWDIKSGNYH